MISANAERLRGARAKLGRRHLLVCCLFMLFMCTKQMASLMWKKNRTDSGGNVGGGPDFGTMALKVKNTISHSGLRWFIFTIHPPSSGALVIWKRRPLTFPSRLSLFATSFSSRCPSHFRLLTSRVCNSFNFTTRGFALLHFLVFFFFFSLSPAGKKRRGRKLHFGSFSPPEPFITSPESDPLTGRRDADNAYPRITANWASAVS